MRNIGFRSAVFAMVIVGLLSPSALPGGEGGHTHVHGVDTETPGASTTPRGGIDEEPSTPHEHASRDTPAEGRSGTSGEEPAAGGNGLTGSLLPGLAGAPNVHPMVVHFPIVLVLTSLLFAGFSWFRRAGFFLRTATWLFGLGLLALPVSTLTGFLAVGGWGGGHVVPHRNLMLLTTALAFVLGVFLWWVADRERLFRIVLTAGLVVVSVVMTLGADRGAWLVFVEGSGVQSAEHRHDH